MPFSAQENYPQRPGFGVRFDFDGLFPAAHQLFFTLRALGRRLGRRAKGKLQFKNKSVDRRLMNRFILYIILRTLLAVMNFVREMQPATLPSPCFASYARFSYR